MYQLIALVAGWLAAAVLAVALYKTDNAATIRSAQQAIALQACQGTLQGLQTRARAAEIEAKAATKAADEYSKGLHKRADVQLSKPATRPGDECGSAADRVQAWQKERTK